MEQDPIFIRMNIAHYQAMLTLDLDDEERSLLKRLLAEAGEDLRKAATSCNSEPEGVGQHSFAPT